MPLVTSVQFWITVENKLQPRRNAFEPQQGAVTTKINNTCPICDLLLQIAVYLITLNMFDVIENILNLKYYLQTILGNRCQLLFL